MAGYVLEIVEEPESGRTVELGAAALVIGREDGVDVLLEADELVSRRHVRLSPAEGGLLVGDLGSRNGTFVNGDEIVGAAHLAPGGSLLVGVTLVAEGLRGRLAVLGRPPRGDRRDGVRASRPRAYRAAWSCAA